MSQASSCSTESLRPMVCSFRAGQRLRRSVAFHSSAGADRLFVPGSSGWHWRSAGRTSAADGEYGRDVIPRGLLGLGRGVRRDGRGSRRTTRGCAAMLVRTQIELERPGLRRLRVRPDAGDLQQSQRIHFRRQTNRLAGEILLKSPDMDSVKAQAHFEHALAIARQQQAKSWELRAAMSMAQLWRDQGKRDKARDLLAPVYGWFTEGFDTLDLKEAKKLLYELAS